MRTIYDVGGCYFCDHKPTGKIGDFPVCDEHERYFAREREHRARRRSPAALPRAF